jgi:hypothetical protein
MFMGNLMLFFDVHVLYCIVYCVGAGLLSPGPFSAFYFSAYIGQYHNSQTDHQVIYVARPWNSYNMLVYSGTSQGPLPSCNRYFLFGIHCLYLTSIVSVAFLCLAKDYTIHVASSDFYSVASQNSKYLLTL